MTLRSQILSSPSEPGIGVLLANNSERSPDLWQEQDMKRHSQIVVDGTLPISLYFIDGGRDRSPERGAA